MSTPQKEQIETGYFVTGEFLGVKRTPWKSDPNKFNHSLGLRIVVGSDGYGNERFETVNIDYFSDAHMQFFSEQGDKLKGRMVSVPVRLQPQAGHFGPYMRHSLPADRLPRVIASATAKAAA